MNDLRKLIKVLTQILNYSLLMRKSPVVIVGTDPVSIKDGYMIHYLEETVLEEITYDTNSGDDTVDALEGRTFLGGDKVFLKGITEVHLTSGACLVYESK